MATGYLTVHLIRCIFKHFVLQLFVNKEIKMSRSYGTPIANRVSAAYYACCLRSESSALIYNDLVGCKESAFR